MAGSENAYSPRVPKFQGMVFNEPRMVLRILAQIDTRTTDCMVFNDLSGPAAPPCGHLGRLYWPGPQKWHDGVWFWV